MPLGDTGWRAPDSAIAPARARRPQGREPEAIDNHDAVARAVRHGDSAAAETAVREIIDEAAAAMRAEFGGPDH